jgi:signal transduction histidine kinase
VGRLIPGGDAGTTVKLTVRTGEFAPRRVTIVRSGPPGLALASLGLSPGFIATYAVVIDIGCALLFLAIATVLALRRAGDWRVTLVSAMLLLVFVGVAWPVLSLYVAQPGWESLLNVWIALALASLCAFFYLFPDGRPVPHWTLGLLGVLLLWASIEPLDPGLYPWKLAPLPFLLVMLTWFGSGVLAQLYRYLRRADAVQRQQTKWVVFGAGAAVIGLAGQVWQVAWPAQSGMGVVLSDLAIYPVGRLLTVVLPISITIAILRYRLWDIDIVINRTLVYGSLTAAVIGLYVAIVGGASFVLQVRGNLLVSLLATGIIAILFAPMRARLQTGVNRLLYGERDEPYVVLSRLGRRLGSAMAPDALLTTVVDTTAEALKIPYVAITLTHGDASTPAASHGTPRAGCLVFPLHYGDLEVGRLMVAPRAPGDAFTPADHRLLSELARETAVAVHAMLLTIDLQRSREQLVAAREEERRRLRRDLHDGLGPVLAGAALKLGVARRHLEPQSPAETLVSEVRADVQTAIGDIRRLVYALRPPVLDELGLVQAIRHQALQCEGEGLCVSVEAPDELPLLPAAVEVAAYRIVQEALTNVVRHAHASCCDVRLAIQQLPLGTWLTIDVIDDGRGLSANGHCGVGLSSMRERAVELGGACTIEPGPRAGVVVRARVPVAHEGAGA